MILRVKINICISCRSQIAKMFLGLSFQLGLYLLMTFYRKINIKANNGPCGRWGHSMVPCNNQIYLFGGYQNANYMNDIWKFNLDTSLFTKLSPTGNEPPPCSSFTLNYFPLRNSLILYGGGSHNKAKLSGLYQLDVERMQWTQIKWAQGTMAPDPRSYHCAEIIDHYLVVFGGEFIEDLADTWIFDFNTNLWQEINNKPNKLLPKASKFHSSFVYKNKFYVLGGCIKQCVNIEQVIYLDFNKFLLFHNEEDLNWSSADFQSQNLLNRWGAVSQVFGDYAYVYGGRLKNIDLQNFVEIDLRRGTCRQLPILNITPEGRRKPSACINNHNLFVFHGYNGSYKSDYGYFQLPFHMQSLRIDYGRKQNPQDKQIISNSLNNLNLKQNVTLQKLIFESQLQKTCKYFINFSNGLYKVQPLIFYPFQQIDAERRQNVMKLFGYFIKENKLSIHSQQKEIAFLYTKDLMILSEYYCMNSLNLACQKQLMQLFNSQIMGKVNLSYWMFRLIDFMNSIDFQHREYIGFCTVRRILLQNKNSVSNFQDFNNICKKQYNNEQTIWIHQIVQKYRFQLSEIINGNDPFFAEMEKMIESKVCEPFRAKYSLFGRRFPN